MFFVGGHVGMWGGMIIAFTLGIYSWNSSGTIPFPFGIHGGGSSIENAALTVCWYFLAIAIGAIIHALIYVALIRISRGEKDVMKNLFKRHKKEEEISTNKNNFSWYEQFVTENWYYKKVYLPKLNLQ
jgi:hypothetical protein